METSLNSEKSFSFTKSDYTAFNTKRKSKAPNPRGKETSIPKLYSNSKKDAVVTHKPSNKTKESFLTNSADVSFSQGSHSVYKDETSCSPSTEAQFLIKKHKILIDALVTQVKLERKQAASTIMKNNVLLGVLEQDGTIFRESREFSSLKGNYEELENHIHTLETEIKKMKKNGAYKASKSKRIKEYPKEHEDPSSNRTKAETDSAELATNTNVTKADNQTLLQTSLKLSFLKQRIESLQKEIHENEEKKSKHIQQSLIYQKQLKSPFSNFSIHKDYLFLELIGFGGFSEVFKGYCLKSGNYVALKIHKLDKNWSVMKKAEFSRRAQRECKIQRDLNHECIVKLIDSFVINTNCFCTVLEFHEGAADLDKIIKAKGVLPEKDAKLIWAQILQGLRHLEENGIVHYDLKPANVLVFDGQVKITDFGLSKCFESKEVTGNVTEFELTSVGAGTYHYLPPECFKENATVNIRSDIWSAGCILYQMLTGRKPYSEGMTPGYIWENKGRHLAKGDLDFPKKIKISFEAKRIIKRCLLPDGKDRPSSKELLEDDYFERL